MPNPENLNPPWKPGESGNPKGHPKGKRNRSTIARQWLEVSQKIKNPITGETEQLEQQDIIMLGLIRKARNGDVQAAKELLDSAYGKLKDKVESDGKVQVTVKYERRNNNAAGTSPESGQGNS